MHENVSSGICGQRRCRSACAFTGWSISMHYAHVWKYLFAWRDQAIDLYRYRFMSYYCPASPYKIILKRNTDGQDDTVRKRRPMLVVAVCIWSAVVFGFDEVTVVMSTQCITRTRLFKYKENFTSKNWKFSNKKKKKKKNIFFFHISAQDIYCGYSLEPPGEAVLTNTHNLCFWAEIRKIYIYTPGLTI